MNIKEKEKNSKNRNSKKNIINIIYIVLIIVFCIILTPVTLQNDTFYTIEIGEHISENGIDMKDPFSWHNDLDYTYPHWLYDYITYIIYNSFGMIGIYISTCLLSSILGTSIYLIGKKLIKNNMIAFFVTIVSMFCLKNQIAARAQLVTFILFIWTIFNIEKFIETKKIKYAVSLIIIPIIIANVHLAVFPFYFVLFLPYIVEYILNILFESIIYDKQKIKKLNKQLIKIEKNVLLSDEERKMKSEKIQNEVSVIEEKNKKREIKRNEDIKKTYKIKFEKKENIKYLIIVFIIAIFTGFITPLGTVPYTYLYNTMEGNTTQNISEHLNLTLMSSEEAIILLIIFVGILTFTKVKIKLRDLFMVSGLVLLMFMSRRNVSMLALIGSITLMKLIYSLITESGENILEKIEKSIENKVGITIITLMLLLFSTDMIVEKIDDKFVDESQYPVQASEYIINTLDIDNTKIYNEYNYGSYLLYKDIPVFIDSRADLYTPEFNGIDEDIFSDAINTNSITIHYKDTFEKYGITHAILPKKSKVNMLISKEDESIEKKYNKLYEDEYFVIYEIIK